MHNILLKKTFLKIAVSSFFIGAFAYTNINGVDTQLFKPTTNGLDFLTVHSTSVLTPWTFNSGLFINASFNSLLKSEDKRSYSAQDILLSSDINIGLGIYENVEIGFNAPAAIYHHTAEDYKGLFFEKMGFLDLSFNLKYSFLPRTENRKWGLAIVPSVNFPIVEDPYFIGYEASPVFNIEAVFDIKIRNYIFGINLGYRLRNPGVDDSAQDLQLIDDQAIASLALAYFREDISTGFICELYAATELRNAFDTERTPMEILGAVKYNPTYNLSLIAGGAFGLSVSIGNPDYRLFAGLNYYFNFSKAKQMHMKNDFEDDLIKIERFSPEEGELKVTISEDKVHFTFNDFRVKGSYRSMLQKIAYMIKTNSKISSVKIIGHTDSIGSKQYNQRLSVKRAGAVQDFLIENGVLDSLLSISGMGVNSPIADNSTFIGRAKNRRVEIIIN